MKLRPPTEEDIKAFMPVIADRYKDMLARMRTVAWSLLSEYPLNERVLACNALLGISGGALAVGLGLSDEDSDAFDKELQTVIRKWLMLAVERNPERFADGLPEPMKRPEGS